MSGLFALALAFLILILGWDLSMAFFPQGFKRFSREFYRVSDSRFREIGALLGLSGVLALLLLLMQDALYVILASFCTLALLAGSWVLFEPELLRKLMLYFESRPEGWIRKQAFAGAILAAALIILLIVL